MCTFLFCPTRDPRSTHLILLGFATRIISEKECYIQAFLNDCWIQVLDTQMLVASVTYGYIQDSLFVCCFIAELPYASNSLVFSLYVCRNVS